jgi:hypothetical protein
VERASPSVAYLRFPLTGHFDSSSTTSLPGFFFTLYPAPERAKIHIHPILELGAYRFVTERVQHEYRLVRRVREMLRAKNDAPNTVRQGQCEKGCAANAVR